VEQIAGARQNGRGVYDAYKYYNVSIVKHNSCTFYYCVEIFLGGPGSSVGIASSCGLDGPGIESKKKSRWGRDFSLLSRPTLGPIQPPVQWVPGLFRG
jgi:hypothetical protein